MPIIPNLLRYRELAVVHYSGAPCVLHLRHAGQSLNLGAFQNRVVKEGIMKHGRKLLVLLLFVFALPLESCVVVRPERPGPHFVWVERYTTPAGVIIHGHWKYVGPPQRHRIWVPGHYNRYGRWIPGHWRAR